MTRESPFCKRDEIADSPTHLSRAFLARGQTEFQVNLKLGLTPHARDPTRPRTPHARDRRPGDRNHVTGAAMDASATRNNVTRTVIDRPAPVDLITRFGGGTRR